MPGLDPGIWFQLVRDCRVAPGNDGTSIVVGAARREIAGAVILDPRRAQTAQTVAVDRTLPGEEFLDREGVALAGFIDAQDAGPDRGHDFGLPPNHPALDAGRRQIVKPSHATVAMPGEP